LGESSGAWSYWASNRQRLLARNRSNQEIADILVLSVKTVRNHISSICTKLHVADRTQAIIRAREAGL
jgi:DNA-binding NarL/FixJ family response regulator